MSFYFRAFLTAFLVSVFLLVFSIPLLHKIKFGQFIRKDGPSGHLKKAGTPTMGGILIILATAATLFYLKIYVTDIDNHYTVLLLIPLIMYGAIGFTDDYIIVVKKNNKGLSPRAKFLFQLIWAGIYFFVFLDKGFSSVLNLFGWEIDLKWGYGILILFMLVGTSNAVNLSDGLDGLASGLMIIALSAVIVLAYLSKEKEILLFSVIVLAAILGFLCFNMNPAKVFMGDTGSLALGATLANLFILLKMEILSAVVGFVFVIETLSDILQVTYFKITHGKRLFLMAPLHHHYELKGLTEWEVDSLFWTAGIVCGVIGLILGYEFYVR